MMSSPDFGDLSDYEVRRAVWDSKVPVEFVLDSADRLTLLHGSAVIAQPSFLYLKRVSYFALQISRPLQGLLGGIQSTTIDSKDIWLQTAETTAQPLKWHHPVGVLFDMYNRSSELPWRVTLRLKDFPDELIRCSKELLQVYFIQTLKEADQLKHRGSMIYSMKAEQHSRLFDSLCNDRFDDFWSVNSQLMNNKSTAKGHSSNANVDSGKILHVPIRFYDTTRALSFRQTLVEPSSTLIDALKSAYELDDERLDDLIDANQAISHGITLPMHTSAIWLARNLAYPDNFVHVVLKPQKND